MADDKASREQPEPGLGLAASIPAMPTVRSDEVYRGRPRLLLEYGLRHSLGWRADRKAGPSFVVVRVSRLDRVRVIERFPLNEDGWAGAWRALSRLDASAASALAALLENRAADSRAATALAALAAESLFGRRVTFNGGFGEVPLAKGEVYDLRFLSDRIMVCPPRSVDARFEVPYRDVETAEVGGRGQVGMSFGDLLLLILSLGLVGALLGLVVHRLVGLLLGAMIFGLVGAFFGASSNKIETIIRIRSKDAELYFLNSERRPEALRFELSEALRAIGNARSAEAADQDGLATLAPGTIPDQLSQLASLLERGLISRDEFDQLKANLIAKS